HLSIFAEAGEASLDAETHGYADVAIHGAARLDGDQRGLTLSALTLAWPEAKWALEAPAHLRFTPQAISAEPLRLVSGQQSISLAGEKRGNKLRADVHVQHLDLAALPHQLIQQNLGGIVDLEARARGSLPTPDVEARASLASGRFNDYAPLD